MSDKDLLNKAIDVLTTAHLINKFTETVWIAVDRKAWDDFMQDDTNTNTNTEKDNVEQVA